MTRAISLHDVSKTYTRGVRVVDRMSLDIRPGEFLVLLGPSGCGKSTVLRMIAGLEEITEGKLLLDGEYSNDLLPSDRNMAMVFQNFALYPNMTSRGNIGFPLRVESPARTRARAWTPLPACSASRTSWSASPASSPAANASVSPWAGPSPATPPPS